MEVEQSAHAENGGASSPTYRLVYMSEVVLPSENDAYATAINDLLRWSRDWNKDHQITGALLFSTGYFAQVLEGPEPAVKALIGNIICDTRHRHLRLLESGWVPERLFGNWSMAYTDGTEQLDLSMMDILGLPRVSQGAAIVRLLKHQVMPRYQPNKPSSLTDLSLTDA
ncbi:BLUF domain-containing protein [Acidisphaera sp. L21]|uniref:BLUF domain-containing protein n=1 Tax=Acidisphaera sp. L21 TaxID=1641851 RepID=UPI00131D0CBB|nr:BLUF domain-containing protein [Acidisphaera sp. L21]